MKQFGAEIGLGGPILEELLRAEQEAAQQSIEQVQQIGSVIQPESTVVVAESSLQVLDDAVAKIEEQGGIEAHKNRYGGDISKCPFLGSMGKAGIELVNNLAGAKKNTSETQGRTLAQILAEKRAAKAEAVQKAIAVGEAPTPVAAEAPVSIKEPTSTEQIVHISDLNLYFANRDKKIIEDATESVEPELRQEVQRLHSDDVRTQAEQVITVARAESADASLAMPVLEKEASEPIVKIAELAERPVILKVPETVLKNVDILTVKTPIIEIINAPVKPFVESVANTFKTGALIADADEFVVGDAMITQITHDSLMQVGQDEHVTEAAFAVHMITFDSIIAFDQEQVRQVEVLDVLMAEWLATEAVERDSAQEVFIEPGEQTVETVAPIGEVVKQKVLETLEAISKIYNEMNTTNDDVISQEATFEQLEDLCVRLYEALGVTPSEGAAKAVAEEIIAKLSVEELNHQGTNEHKLNVAATIQAHLLKIMRKRRQRFVEVTRYILQLMSATFSPAVGLLGA